MYVTKCAAKYRQMCIRLRTRPRRQVRRQLDNALFLQGRSQLYRELREQLHAALFGALFAKMFGTLFEKTFASLFESFSRQKFL